MAVIRTRLNLYNNATNCYEVTGGVGKKTRSAKIFWFSLLLGYFLMSYRRSCLIVRRLGLLMARYRALYRKYRTIQLSGSLHKKIAYKRNSSNNIFVKSAPKLLRSNFGIRTSVFSSVSNKSIRKLRHAKTKYKYRYHAKTGRRIAFPTRFILKRGALHSKSWFSRCPRNLMSMHEHRLDMYNPWNIHKDLALCTPNRIANQFYNLAAYKYIRALHIIKKYRRRLVEKLLIKKSKFFFQINFRKLATNNYLVPSKRALFARFLIEFLFDLRYRKKWSRRRKFEHIIYLRKRLGTYFRDLSKWIRIRRYFKKRRRSKHGSARWGLPPQPFKMTFMQLYGICSVILGAGYNTNLLDEYRRERVNYLQGSMTAHRLLTHSVYGISPRGMRKYVHRLQRTLRLDSKKLASPLKLYHYIENQLKYFLAFALHIPIKFIESLSRSNRISVNGSVCRMDQLISAFDCITIKQPILSGITEPVVTESVYNNWRLWYLWIYMLKSWNRCVAFTHREISSYFLQQLYIVYKDLPSMCLVHTKKYISYHIWPFKTQILRRYRTLLLKFTHELLCITAKSDYFDIYFEPFYDIVLIYYSIDHQTILNKNSCFFSKLEFCIFFSKKLKTKYFRLTTLRRFLRYPRYSRTKKRCKSAVRVSKKCIYRLGYLPMSIIKHIFYGIPGLFLRRLKQLYSMYYTPTQKIIVRSPYRIAFSRYITSYLMRRMHVNTRNYQIWTTVSELAQTVSTHILLYNFTYDTYRSQLSLLYKNTGNKLVANTYLPAWYI